MNDNALKFAQYWRNSLADAERGQGGLRVTDLKEFIRLPVSILHSGTVGDEVVEALFADESEQTNTVEVTVRPMVYRAQLEHGVASGDSRPAVVTPIVSRALVSRDGQLFPTTSTVIPRDILEPLEAGSFALGSVEDVDHFLTENPVQHFEPPADGGKPDDHWYAERWSKYLQFCERFLAQVGQGWPGKDDRFLLGNEWYLFKEQKIDGASQHIVRLYDHLRTADPSVPLFERYAEQIPRALEQCLPTSAGFAARLGHASDTHSLAIAQRDALTHLLIANDGDILGVNGPPGTGKTTLLLSVVASLWAKAALTGAEPPVIVASSTNNQAVTNIIDAFGKDFSTGKGPFSGRWLPDIKSFGAYFPSSSKETEMAEKYQTRSFIEAVESADYLAKAKSTYIGKAADAFPNENQLTVQVVVDRLQQEIQARAKTLGNIEAAWQDLTKAREVLRVELGNDPHALLEERRHLVSRQATYLAGIRGISQGFEQYLANESIFFELFNWLPPVANKRLRLAMLYIKSSLPSGESGAIQLLDDDLKALDSWSSVSEIEAGLAEWNSKAAAHLATLQALLLKGEQLVADEQRCVSNWSSTLTALKLPFGFDEKNIRIEDCDALADTQVRFPIFLLTTHYWEGRWLLEIEESLEDILKSGRKNGRKTLEKRWRRWMKLTPCIVSTFFMLPKEMKGSRHDGNGLVPDYMYNLIDLLIVDEAGQVLPEVAGASFALGKQSLVIGDTLQIEPIWSVPASVDIGNLVSAELLPRNDIAQFYDVLCSTGKSSASGSVMQIAQAASRYQYDADMERGMFLYEHRRCYDSIIDYCNRLCYHGKLQPKRGNKPAGSFPGLGYLHVDGLCQQSNGGSRSNRLEAETIAAWLAANRAQLEGQYKKDISEIVGVITPFGAQTQTIADACRSRGIKTGKGNGELTVGTVHSFQGAERPVVIFSAVYSKHADGGFIDRRQSMLNVAVSRAKDSFLVFGDMDVLGAVSPTKPRGLLAEYLLHDPASELHFDYQPRTDLQTALTGLEHLHEAAEHDRFLLQTLNSALREVHIVTPWLLLGRIKEIRAWEAMLGAVKRGVRVSIYTDLEFNTKGQNDVPEVATKQIYFKQAIDALREQRIEAYLMHKVHSKIVMADDNLLCIGSFNWFSASRKEGYARHETSMVYRGPDVVSEIEVNRRSLTKRMLSVQAV